MRIIIFTPVVYPFFLDMTKAIIMCGNHARVCGLGIFGNYPFKRSVDGYIEANESTIGRSIGKAIGTDLPSIQLIGNILKNRPNGIIIFGSESAAGILVFFIARLIHATPIVIVEENNTTISSNFIGSMLQKIRIFLTSKVYESAQVLVAESHASRKYATGLLNCSRKSPIYVKVHGVNVDKFKPMDKQKSRTKFLNKYDLKIPEDNKIAVFVGELSAYKGADVLIDAILLLNKQAVGRTVTFLLPMRGPLLKDLRANDNLKYLEKQHSIVFYSSIEEADIPLLYNCADFIVIPSRKFNNMSSDRSPNAVLEAMACGKIIIASDAGGIPTIIGNAAVTVKANDPALLASNMQDVVENSSAYEHLAIKAHDRAVQELSMAEYVRFLLGLFKTNCETS